MSTNPVKRLESTNIENKVNNSSENVFPTKNEWKEHYYELKKYSFIFGFLILYKVFVKRILVLF